MTVPSIGSVWDVVDKIDSSENLFADFDAKELYSIDEDWVGSSESKKELEGLLNQKVVDLEGNEVTAQDFLISFTEKLLGCNMIHLYSRGIGIKCGRIISYL
jgi:hypothetical protein